MLLCLDVGNTQLLGGVFASEKLIFRFRYATPLLGSPDQFGIFLVNTLQLHDIDFKNIKAIALSSVVPECECTLRRCFLQYFRSAAYFLLQSGVKTGLNIRCKNPSEVGTDRIANAIGATNLFPGTPLIVVDMGTATTLCAITENAHYLGGAILPGIRLSMEALRNNTAKLMMVDIEAPEAYLGRTTRENIQSGLYYGHFGAIKELIAGFKREVFPGESVKVIGTGGAASLYETRHLFDVIIPDLALLGLQKAFQLAEHKNKPH